MTSYLSVYDLSKYLAVFVDNFQDIWVDLNTSVYDLIMNEVLYMIPEPFTITRAIIYAIGLLFEGSRDFTIFGFLIGGFATMFIGFTVVKFLLDLVN